MPNTFTSLGLFIFPDNVLVLTKIICTQNFFAFKISFLSHFHQYFDARTLIFEFIPPKIIKSQKNVLKSEAYSRKYF